MLWQLVERILYSARAGQSMKENFIEEMALKLSLEGWMGDDPGVQEHCKQRECVRRHREGHATMVCLGIASDAIMRA